MSSRSSLRSAPLDPVDELMACGLFDIPFVTASAEVELLGEVGEVIGRLGDQYRVRFTPEQAFRMAGQIELGLEADRGEA